MTWNPTTNTPYGITVYDFSASATPALNSNMLTDLAAAGIKRLRFQMNWPLIETGVASYTWSGLDNAIQACNTAGIAVTLCIQYQSLSSQTWYPHQTVVSGLSGTTYLAADPVSLASFATAICTRYNGSSGSSGYVDSFETNEEYDASDQGVESGQNATTITTRDPRYYVNVMRKLAMAVRAAHPTCKFGSCAMVWDPPGHIAHFMSQLYQQGIGPMIDYWSLHWYPQENVSSGTISPLSWAYTGLSSYGYTIGANAPVGSVTPSNTANPYSFNQCTFPQMIHAMVATMQYYNDLKPIRVTEGGWLLNTQNGHTSSANSVVSADVQARNYYFWYNFCRKSGIVSGVDPWTIHYGNGSTAASCDGYSIVQNPTTYNVFVKQQSYYTIQAISSAYPSWGATQGFLANFIDGDMFITEPNCAGAARNDSTTSFGQEGNGSAWTHVAGSGTPKLATSQGHISASSGATVDYFTLGTNTDDNVELELRIALTNAADSGGLIARVTGSALASLNCYYLKFDLGHLAIYKVINGTATSLASTAATYTSGANYRLKFNVNGSSLQGKVWLDSTTTTANAEPSAWTVSVTDSSVTGVGKIGIAGNSSSADIVFDSFWGMQADASYSMPKNLPINSFKDGGKLPFYG
jgi:hypothetical protein